MPVYGIIRGKDGETGERGETGWNERQIQREREKEERRNEGETRWPRSREGGWYVWAGSSQGGSGSAAGGEIMGADEPESKH